MSLHISPDLDLPIDVATDTNALLAKKGAGKSNAAIVLVEELHSVDVPFIYVDPKGDSWGIRSSADGTKAGLPVVVFGGLHGDVPLEPTAGALIADLILGDDDRGYLSCVLDVSQFSYGERDRFLLAFGERLFRRKDEERVLHLILEEAHEYLPQTVGRAQAQLVGMYQRIVKQGRFKGLGITLISQRSAALNKDVLTQADNLFMLRTTSPQDRAAVKAWFDEHAEAGDIIKGLPSLANGECWLWSPERSKDPAHFTFRRRRTFDSGATPKVGEKRVAPRTLADVDLGAVKEAMAETIERAKADDPRELRKRIRELEHLLATAQAVEIPEPIIERVEVSVLTDEDRRTLGAQQLALADAAQSLNETVSKYAQILTGQKMPLGPFDPANLRKRTTQTPVTSRQGAAGSVASPVETPSTRRRPPTPRSDTTPPAGDGSSAVEVALSRSQHKILDALAWFQTVGIPAPTRGQVAFQARVSPRSSGFEKNCSTLRTRALIEYPAGNLLMLTDQGGQLAEWPARPGTAADMQQAFYEGVSGPQATILRRLVQIYPSHIDRECLADAAGVSAASSGFEKNLSTLRSLGLVDYPAPGLVAATDLLFLDG